VISAISQKLQLQILKFEVGKEFFFEIENRSEYVYVVDGIRCLIGMNMKTPEMQNMLRSFVEAKCLKDLYNKPEISNKPPNYNFVRMFE